ncbi:MAG: hypothetical protein K8T10_05995 [Candidatus Eremiobacteraeota bacterium]|nr:hypothetical protein [Candidatus Eremiobacteraeota bacterium]
MKKLHIIIIFLLILAILGTAFYFVNSQQKKTLEALDKSIAETKEELKKSEERMKQAKLANEAYIPENVNFDEFIRSNFKAEDKTEFTANFTKDIRDLFATVKQCAKDPNFKIASIKSGEIIMPDSGKSKPDIEKSAKVNPKESKAEKDNSTLQKMLSSLPHQEFDMKIQGNNEACMSFLKSLGELKSKRLIRVDNIKITTSGDSNGKESTVMITNIKITAFLIEKK